MTGRVTFQVYFRDVASPTPGAWSSLGSGLAFTQGNAGDLEQVSSPNFGVIEVAELGIAVVGPSSYAGLIETAVATIALP